MEKEINSNQSKGTTFVVEIIKKEDDSRLYVVRTPQGFPIKVLDTPEEVAQFFNECKF